MTTINLKKLDYSPKINPLMTSTEVPIKAKRVRSGLGRDLVDPQTGEVTHSAFVHTIQDIDQDQFVKVFAAGVRESYKLTLTGFKVFQAVLVAYERSPMSGGWAETVILSWFGEGLAGEDIGMSQKTFQRGLKELLGKGFIAPKEPNIFWVNPGLFFRGDRVLMIREYRRQQRIEGP